MFKRTPKTAATSNNATTTTTRTHAARHHVSGPLAAIFALYFMFGLIELGLMIDIVKYFHSKFERIVPDWIEARAGYATWAAAWTFIVPILYFILAKFWRGFRWYHVVALTVLTFVFWITAAPLLEIAFVHTPYRTCIVVFGKSKCQQLKAARAFAWLLMVLSLLSIPAAWFFSRRAARTEGTQPVAKEVQTTGHTPVTTGHTHATSATHGTAVV